MLRYFSNALSTAIKLFVWAITLGGYFPILRACKHGMNIEGELVFSVDPAFFVWPIIIAGFFGNIFVAHWPGTAVFWGWVWSMTLIYIFLAVLTNLNILKLVIWGFVFGFFLVLSKYIEALHHIPLLSPVFTHLRNLNPRLDTGIAALISWLLLIPWIGSIFHSVTCGCKKFTPNQIEELYAFEGSDMIDRGGLHFITRYNDLLESVLGVGSGDIIALDSTGKVQKEWHNILFLFFLWPRLQEILEQRVTTVDNSARDAANVQDVNVKPLVAATAPTAVVKA